VYSALLPDTEYFTLGRHDLPKHLSRTRKWNNFDSDRVVWLKHLVVHSVKCPFKILTAFPVSLPQTAFPLLQYYILYKLRARFKWQFHRTCALYHIFIKYWYCSTDCNIASFPCPSLIVLFVTSTSYVYSITRHASVVMFCCTVEPGYNDTALCDTLSITSVPCGTNQFLTVNHNTLEWSVSTV